MEKLDIDYLQCYINRNKDNKTPEMAENLKWNLSLTGKLLKTKVYWPFP
jgi:hypothetical protein